MDAILIDFPKKKSDDVVFSAISQDSHPLVLQITKTVVVEDHIQLSGTKGHVDLHFLVDNDVMMLEALDTHLKNSVMRHSKEWFGQEFPSTVIDAFYVPFLHRESPVLRAKIPMKNSLPLEDIILSKGVIGAGDEGKLMDRLDILQANTGKECTFVVVVKGIRYNKKEFKPEVMLKEIITPMPVGPDLDRFSFTPVKINDAPKDTPMVSSSSNLDKFYARRKKFVEQMTTRKKKLDETIHALEKEKDIIVLRLDEVDSEAIDESNYDYLTDDEFLEEEIQEQLVCV
jgi:hypothetical protein